MFLHVVQTLLWMSLNSRDLQCFISSCIVSTIFSTNRNRNFRISTHISDKCESSRSSVWFGKLKKYIYAFWYNLCCENYFCVRTFRNKNMNLSDLLSGFYYTFYRFIFLCILEDFCPSFFWLKELHQLQTSYLMVDLQEIHTFIKADG